MARYSRSRSRGRSRTRKRARYSTPSASASRGSRSVSFREHQKSGFRRAIEAGTRTLAHGFGGPIGGAIANAGIEYMTGSTKSTRTAGAGSGMGPAINKRGMKKRKYKKKKITRSYVESKGITENIEIGYKTKAQTEGDKMEALAVGHTTMPIKPSLLNLCRGIVKYLATRIGIDIVDLAQAPPQFNNGRVAMILFIGFDNTSPTTITAQMTTPSLCTTWDEFAYRIYILLTNISDIGNTRFFQLRSEAFSNTAGHQYPDFYVNMTDLKVQVATTSELRVQNQTVNETGDEDAQEVDNVPLHGVQFMLKGNNCLRKSNWQLLGGHKDGDETLLFRAWGPSSPGTIWNEDYDQPYASNQAYGSATNPNDLPKISELQNCVSSNSFMHNPGVIRTSYLRANYEMSVLAYLKILLASRGQENNKIVYDQRCGKTAVLWYDKVIGNQNTPISINTECQFRQSVYVYGKTKPKTLPLNFQVRTIQP